MGQAEASRQADNVTEPVQGFCLAITVDTTSRTYDTQGLQFFDKLTTNGKERTYLTLAAEGAKVYYAFSNLSATAIDDAAAVTAGGALAFANTYCEVIFDGTKDQVRWERAQHRYLVLKASASGKLRLRASSDPSAGSLL